MNGSTRSQAKLRKAGRYRQEMKSENLARLLAAKLYFI